ncbi:retrovirus-related pol polyprotein from transposon TNT 1-94 [Tanacetum coccineum]|uniref:Retrovirus-related pol polyprotein from transposon TNT 1-94 n=1 Tax=Tanacetum coccineum TaxID=301880 RepID=A0ABQ4ZVJ5_9ASTR
MAKASTSQAWLWHRRLSHLNFDTINLLSKYDIVNGLDHLCSSCELGKAKYETPKVLVNFPKLIQRGLHAQVKTVRTDKGTEFLNKTLHAYFAQEGIEHQTLIARTPEQNGVVERRNRTLVEDARTMLSAAKVPLDGENLDKMKEKGDACIFIGYSTQSRAYKSSAITNADAPNQRQQQHTTPSTSTTVAADIPPLNIQTTPETLSQAPTQASTVTPTENINQAETNKEYALVDEDEFINIFSIPIQERGETSS